MSEARRYLDRADARIDDALAPLRDLVRDWHRQTDDEKAYEDSPVTRQALEDLEKALATTVTRLDGVRLDLTTARAELRMGR